MRAHLLLQTLFILLAIRSAFPQAAAEAALANGHAAAATTKVGSFLGDSLNKANNKIAESLKTASQPQPVPRASTRPVRSSNSSSAPTATRKGANTISIQGGRVTGSSVASTRGTSNGANTISIQGGRASGSSVARTHGTSNGANTISIQGGCASGSATAPTPSCPN